MTDTPRYATFRDYLRVVRERRILIVLVALVFGAAALGWSVRQDPQYEADTTVQFKDENVDSSILGTVTLTGQTPEQRAAISAQSISRPEVAERARKIMKSPLPARVLQSLVVGRPETRTNLVVITARAGDPYFAADVANAFAKAARDLALEDTRERYQEAADAQRAVLDDLGDSPTARVVRATRSAEIAKLEQLAKIVRPVEILSPARVPTAPVSPRPVMNTVLALLLGLAVGLVAAFARDSLDRRFKNSREITSELHLPLVGYVREDLLGRTIVGNGQKPLTGDELESFRILRTNVEFLDVDRPPKVVLVTSALPEEGKSTVAGALACAYVTAGKRTLVVECDLRRPTLAKRLALKPAPGLTDYLVGAASPREILQTLEITPATTGNGSGPDMAADATNLVCIMAGTPGPQPAEMLRSQRFKSFLAQVCEVYDTVILDSAPLLSVVDTLELLPESHAVVLCIRASQTTRDQARAAKSAMEHFPSRATGVVVTGVRAREEADAYGYYSYGYVYGSKPS